MESAMRMIRVGSLVAVCGMLACAPAQADWPPWFRGTDWLPWVPPFKGNDTGGIIAYQLGQQTDGRQLARAPCAFYGMVVNFLAGHPKSGASFPFACRWVPYGASERPLRTRY